MIRNLKGLGLALVAIIVMSAMSVSGAQAATPTIVTGVAGTVSGDQVGVHELTFGSRALNCKKAHFAGTSALVQTEMTIVFEYAECSTTPVLGISFPATVTPNGCKYTITNLKHVVPDYTADVSIICEAGKKIEVHMYKDAKHTENLCTLTIESNQNALGTNTITNVAGSPDDLLIHHNVKILVENHNPNAICGEATSTAEYHGTTTLKAFNGAGVQTTLTAVTEPEEFVEGEQVGVHEFTVGSRAVKCKVATFSGAIEATQETLTITPHYSECSTTPVLGISFPVTVTANGCDYLFTNLEHTRAAGDYDAKVSVGCPEGKKIEVHVYGFKNTDHTEQLCTLTIESDQTDLSGNTITNVAGSPDDLLIHHNVKLKVENHNPNAICGEATSTAEYHGTTTLKAFNKVEQRPLVVVTVAGTPLLATEELAEPEEFVEGEQVGVHEFTVGSRAVKCKVATFSGAVEATQETLTITPHYSECSTTPVLGISFPVTVTANGCDYLFTNLEHTQAAGDYDAKVSIGCTEGKKIEVHVYNAKSTDHTEQLCTLTIESDQTDLATNTITNVAGSPDDLLIHHNVKLKVENHNPNAICGEATSTAEYHGTTTLKAFNEVEQRQLTVATEGSTPQLLVEEP